METMKQRVAYVVNELFQQHKEVKASMLVKAAEPKTSPAHDAFEWDDTKAGHEYRLWQARSWIKRVEIVIEDRKEKLIHVPTIISASENRKESDQVESQEGYYKPISIVVNSSTEYSRALDEMSTKLKSAISAYDNLKTAAECESITNVDFEKADEGFALVESAISFGTEATI